jgi:hypothetical protein
MKIATHAIIQARFSLRLAISAILTSKLMLFAAVLSIFLLA